MKESDLYYPVKRLFENKGYTVNGEVCDIDLTASNGEELIAVEMKKSINMSLILQAIKRQRITEKVYVAVPRPEYRKRFYKEFKEKEYLLRRLEVGLILVALDVEKPYAQIVFEPKVFNRELSMSKSRRKKDITIKEIKERHGDYNIGGSTGKKLVTVYREKTLFIAALLKENNEMKIKEMIEAGADKKATAILNKNYYGWFERVARGTYRLSKLGIKELQTYNNVIDSLR